MFLLIVMGLVFGESALLLDLVIPGEVGLVVAGAAAAQNGTPLPMVIAAATLGAVAGDSACWFVGHRWGTRFAEEGPLRRWLAPGLAHARRRFERGGGGTVFVARFVGALRAVVPVVAGSAGMPYRRLIAWSLPAAAAWSTLMATIGHRWGGDIADAIDRIGLGVSAAVVLALVAVVVVHRRRGTGRSGPAHADAVSEEGAPGSS